jgi:hypothetical protein
MYRFLFVKSCRNFVSAGMARPGRVPIRTAPDPTTSDVGAGGTSNVAAEWPSRWMGAAAGQDDHAVMDDTKLQHNEVPAIRSFRICLDQPQRPTTLLGIIRRVATEQASSGQASARRVSRAAAFPRRTSVFA